MAQRWVILLTAGLLLGASGCRRGAATTTPAPAPSPTALPSATPSPAPTATPSPTPEPTVALGEEQRVEAGGFVFRQLLGYEIMSPSERAVSLTTPGYANAPLNHARIVLSGGPNVERLTAGQLHANFAERIALDAATETVGAPQSFTVAEQTGVAADWQAEIDGQVLLGRVVFIASEQQGFTALAQAPADRWAATVEREFEAVLNTIVLLEP